MLLKLLPKANSIVAEILKLYFEPLIPPPIFINIFWYKQSIEDVILK